MLADMEYVVDFVQMQRFDDQLQVQVLEAMRTEGGKTISEESWRAIVATQICDVEPAAQSPASSSGLLSLLCGTPTCEKREVGTNQRMSGASCHMLCMPAQDWMLTMRGRSCFTYPLWIRQQFASLEMTSMKCALSPTSRNLPSSQAYCPFSSEWR